MPNPSKPNPPGQKNPGQKNSSQKNQAKTGNGRRGRKSGGARPKRGLAGGLLRLALVAGIWAVVALGGLFAYFAYDLPDFKELYVIERRNSVTLKAADGTVLATYGDLYGEHRTLSELPKHLPQALIGTEDRRFYDHFGLDPIGLARAMWVNMRAGRVVQGGSTLTQQLAKNVFLDSGRTLKRKAQEVLLALWLERNFTKDQILEMYLNRVYFGAGAYGVEAAAQRYFDKPATQLSLTESAMLVGLLKAPSRLAPTGNIKSAQQRASQVLRNMADAGLIDDSALDAALKRPAQLAASRSPMPNARYFADWVLEEVYQLVGRQHGDLVVLTSLDARLQQAAERSVSAVMGREGEKQNAEQAALVALSPDGAVRAMVGGRDYIDSPFNRATQARRQPGSAFKPIVFLTAVETGIEPGDMFSDTPITIDGKWSPRNFDGKYQGDISFAEAAARSSNAVAVRLSEQVGRQRVIDTARRLGIVSDLKPHPSLALGAFETGLLELSNAYVAFANGGYTVMAYGVREVADGNGNVLFRRGNESVMAHMIDEQPLGMLNDLLRGVVDTGTGRAARLPNRQVAGKTGTTSDYRDAWFIGYTPDLIAGVWVGNDDNSPMNKVSGGGLPAQIWRGFMNDALRGSEPRDLPTARGGLQRLLSGLLGSDAQAGPAVAAPPNNNSGSTNEPSLWDRILRQFGRPQSAGPAQLQPSAQGSPAADSRADSRARVESPMPGSQPGAQGEGAIGDSRMIWQVGPQPARQ